MTLVFTLKGAKLLCKTGNVPCARFVVGRTICQTFACDVITRFPQTFIGRFLQVIYLQHQILNVEFRSWGNFSLYSQALYIIASVALKHSYLNLMQSVIFLNLFEKISLQESFLDPKESFYRFQNTLKNISRHFVKAFYLIKTILADLLRTQHIKR